MRIQKQPLMLGLAAAAFAGAWSFGQAAAAQGYWDTPTAGEVVVHPERGMMGPDGRPMRLTRVVEIGDLDLATWGGRHAMRERVGATARELCDELGEGNTASDPLVPSCRDQAERDARPQMNVAVDQAMDNAYAVQAAADPYVSPY